MEDLPPQFTEIVQTVRDRYVDQFTAIVRGLSQDTHIVEPVLLDSDGNVVGGGPLDLPYRADYIALATGRSEMVTSAKMLRFELFSFEAAQTTFAIAPFIWDYVAIDVTGKWDDAAASVIQTWFDKAFGLDSGADNLALQGAVHYVSDPQIDEDSYGFVVDFGTAPASALTDLLSALSSSGAQFIAIGKPKE